MSDNEAYLQLVIMVGILLCLPYFCRVFYILGQVIVAKYFPPKYLKIEILDEFGGKRVVKVNLDNSEELVNTLLKVRGNI